MKMGVLKFYPDGEAPVTQNPDFELWLEFEWQEPCEEDDPEDDFFNMIITLLDGRKYALNVWTYRFLNRAVAESRREGQNLNGAYLRAPDLFVARRDRPLLEAIVADLLQRGRLADEWLLPPEEPDNN